MVVLDVKQAESFTAVFVKTAKLQVSFSGSGSGTVIDDQFDLKISCATAAQPGSPTGLCT